MKKKNNKFFQRLLKSLRILQFGMNECVKNLNYISFDFFLILILSSIFSSLWYPKALLWNWHGIVNLLQENTFILYIYFSFFPRRILSSTFYTNMIASRFSLLQSTFIGSVIVCNLERKIHNLLCVPSGFRLVINAGSGDLVFYYDYCHNLNAFFIHIHWWYLKYLASEKAIFSSIDLFSWGSWQAWDSLNGNIFPI